MKIGKGRSTYMTVPVKAVESAAEVLHDMATMEDDAFEAKYYMTGKAAPRYLPPAVIAKVVLFADYIAFNQYNGQSNAYGPGFVSRFVACLCPVCRRYNDCIPKRVEYR